MKELDVVLFYSSGWLEAVILEWNWMFHHKMMIPECDRWMTRPDEGETWEDCISKHKAHITDTLMGYGYTPNFIEYILPVE